jgi:adhesin/invasin
VITTLGQSFGVPAAWPVAVQADVRDDCGNMLNTGSVKVSFSNGDPPLSLQSMRNGLWETTWMAGHAAGPVTMTVTAGDPTGALTGTRDVTGGLGDSSTAPSIDHVANGASFTQNTPLAPSAYLSVFGQGLANGTSSINPPLLSTLSGASVVMAGNALPLSYAADGQINAVVPAGISINTNQQLLVQRGTTLSLPVAVDVGPVAPAIFPYPLPGDPPNQGAIANPLTYAVAQPGSPVAAGDVIAIFCTGLGAVDQSVKDGNPAPLTSYVNTLATPVVTVGGKMAQVSFSGLAPGFAGLYQINASVPSGVAPGNQVPVVVTIGGQTAPAATIAVK